MPGCLNNKKDHGRHNPELQNADEPSPSALASLLAGIKYMMVGPSSRPGTGNVKLSHMASRHEKGWVADVTGVVVWVKPVDSKEKSERRKRWWRNLWRSGKEAVFDSTANYDDRYAHQIFLIAIDGDPHELVVRIENNLHSGKELKSLAKGHRVQIAGEYFWNPKGGKIHNTHGNAGYARFRTTQ
eukprot:NODE_2482_length_1055_cov_34.539871_g2464_i0.p1 GENE.NODE_2482_length_1055_cov_34.539871_g2464_i0~~NODE_2482_length_1055_cov_34.539871_g2464_i0.p1  ORF type:complete len:185 (-),score=17.33 NODE_2482_length_1055_cov_34.539871_g2464_i0:413-967(-)